jgi:hypothetical protein
LCGDQPHAGQLGDQKQLHLNHVYGDDLFGDCGWHHDDGDVETQR